jgi:hypothetical protein
MSNRSSPVLPATEKTGPSLDVGNAALNVHQKDMNTRQVAWVLGIFSLVVCLVLVGLSHIAKQPDRVSLTASAVAWLQSQVDEDEHDSAQELADEESDPDADPFMHEELAALKGQTCFNFMPGGDNPAAIQVFERMFWSEIGDDLKKPALTRMDTCTPFQAIEHDLIMATGCSKKQCPKNDVRFFIDTEGGIAIDFQINGRCESASSEGFNYKELMCQRNENAGKTPGV